MEGGEKEQRGKINMPKRKDTDWFLVSSAILVVFGIILFLFGNQVATQTRTDLNYSVLGAFIFLVGLVMFVTTRPTKRRR